MARNPFEYYDGCTGPTVDTDIVPTGFTFCDDVEYTSPTLVLHDFPITVPDVAPPPLCNGLAFAGVSFAFTGIISGTMDMSKGGSACAPGVSLSVDLAVPCIAFQASWHATINTGSIFFQVTPDPVDCVVRYTLNIGLPPLGGSPTGVLVTVVTDVYVSGINLMQNLKVVKVLEVVTNLGGVVAVAGTDCTSA